MPEKRGKRKLTQRSVDAASAARRLARKTQTRAQSAFAAVLGGGPNAYGVGDFFDDVMEGTSDVIDAFRGPAARGQGLPAVTFVARVAGVIPPRDLVSLTDSVTAGLIDRGDLSGVFFDPVTSVATPIGFAGTNYRLRLPDNPFPVIGGAMPDEVDEVFVEFTALPANQGVYRGLLLLQNSLVLAEIILVMRP
jgi:hypothetical protein